MRDKVFDVIITDLLQIGSIYLYLTENYKDKDIAIDVWEHFLRKPTRFMTDQNQIEKFRQYLLNQFQSDQIRVLVWEQERQKIHT